MKKRIELPLVEPLFKTYHHYCLPTAVLNDNPSIRNYYITNSVSLVCGREFLSGYTTPKLNIACACDTGDKLFEKLVYPMRHLKGRVNSLICDLLDEGYYVFYNCIDDFYVEGKSWYKEKHFGHNGLICGYDKENKTYCLYAYDSNWVLRKFWTSKTGFEKGRKAMFEKNKYGNLCAIKPKDVEVLFSTEIAIKKIREHLESDLEKFPENGEGNVRGLVVHIYLAKYLDMLYDGSISYERMDRRVFRLIWEHKKVMLERIEKIEQELNLADEISKKYKLLVSEADTMRMLYASHHMKRRDSVLSIIKNKLLKLMDEEKKLLTLLLEKTEGRFENDAVGISKE